MSRTAITLGACWFALSASHGLVACEPPAPKSATTPATAAVPRVSADAPHSDAQQPKHALPRCFTIANTSVPDDGLYPNQLIVTAGRPTVVMSGGVLPTQEDAARLGNPSPQELYQRTRRAGVSLWQSTGDGRFAMASKRDSKQLGDVIWVADVDDRGPHALSLHRSRLVGSRIDKHQLHEPQPLATGQTAPNIKLVGAADLDGDGKTDFISQTNSAGPRGMLFRRATFSVHSLVDSRLEVIQQLPGELSSPGRPIVADLDGDGFPELIVPGHDGERRIVAWWRNQRGRLAAIQTLPCGDKDAFGGGTERDNQMEVADFDGDGDRDVAVISRSNELCWFASSRKSLQLRSTIKLPGYSGMLASGDLDGDGVAEIVTRTYEDLTPEIDRAKTEEEAVAIMRRWMVEQRVTLSIFQPAGAELNAVTLAMSTQSVYRLWVADVNEDRRADLVGVSAYDGGRPGKALVSWLARDCDDTK